MKSASTHKHSGFLPALLRLKCPHCRQGNMFVNPNSYGKGFMKMHRNCPVCGQDLDPEPSFYYGTGYVSYALAVAVSVASFITWWVIIGFSFHDTRFFWWIGINAVLLLALQPYLMRLSRTMWLSFFVKYDKECTVTELKAETDSKHLRA